MSKKVSKKVYTEEFKQSAVEMVVVQRHTISSVATRLGVNYHTLRKWVLAAKSSAPQSLVLKDLPAEQRIRELEKENVPSGVPTSPKLQYAFSPCAQPLQVGAPADNRCWAFGSRRCLGAIQVGKEHGVPGEQATRVSTTPSWVVEQDLNKLVLLSGRLPKRVLDGVVFAAAIYGFPSTCNRVVCDTAAFDLDDQHAEVGDQEHKVGLAIVLSASRRRANPRR